MVLLGGSLVVATWLVMAAVVVSLGLIFVRPNARPETSARFTVAHFATAAWWGLGIVTVLAYLLAFFVPLRSPTTALVLITITVLIGALGWRGVRKSGIAPTRWTLPAFALAIALILATIYLALAALGPVTHYDAGLYQWAAVQYASDFAALPGIANLYGPLGYASAEPVLGAVLSATPWQSEGFRLLNSLFLLLLALETLNRFISHPRRPGTAVTIAGSALIYPPMLWMADFWVTSPTPDLPVLVLAVVAAAYLADLTTGKGANPLPTMLVLAALMTALRPTSALLSLLLVLTAVVVSVARRNPLATFPLTASVALTALMVVSVTARDRMLSGWLQYPLSIYAFDVPWRAPNPDGLRSATLGFARDPQNWQEATSGFDWVPSWLSRLPQQWEPWWFLAALLAGLVLLATRHTRPRALAATAAPFAIAAVAWWTLTPPALRFGWGPLFGLTAILLGWGLWRRRLQIPATYALAAGIAVISVVALAIRLDGTTSRETHHWLNIPYEVVPLPTPSTQTFITDSELVLRVPTDTDQCWSVYPLCTPDAKPTLRLLDGGFAAGLGTR